MTYQRNGHRRLMTRRCFLKGSSAVTVAAMISLASTCGANGQVRPKTGLPPRRRPVLEILQKTETSLVPRRKTEDGEAIYCVDWHTHCHLSPCLHPWCSTSEKKSHAPASVEN